MPGAVDFAHRTFQDCLGAREIVEWQHFPALVEKAHEDQWENVVRMAVAHAQPLQRGELLTALVERGDRDTEHRVRLHLLAAACLEYAPRLGPEIRAEAVRRADRHLPPRLRDEAVTLGRIGSVALELLPGPEELTDAEAREVVFTATRVGTEAALPEPRAFRGHSSTAVRHLLTVNRNRFDTDRSLGEIVSHLPRADADLAFPATTREELARPGTLTDLARMDPRGDLTAEEILAALSDRPLTGLALGIARRSATSASCANGQDSAYSCWTSARTSPICPPSREHPCGRCISPAQQNSGDRTDCRHSARWKPSTWHPRAARPVPDLTGPGAWPGPRDLAVHQLAHRPFRQEEWRAIAGMPHLSSQIVQEPELAHLVAAEVE
ncbi:hypothetical protein [Streptomyces sp. URMC 129]|uniref:hypothetical protein n=1 Tax=Streptomyces sp. URMC 129 TaxID=3423407 RepID=UPI003F1C3F5F